MVEEQQFCLRWNNFQANIISQFETLRDAEDFTDVTIVCESHRLQAHKVVLSACSPLFKDLFKNNPCSHPIIFMRDVEARHIIALMEFMYAGEVNVGQTHLSSFLKTAESLKIRGLTDTPSEVNIPKEENTIVINHRSKQQTLLNKNKFSKPQASCLSTVTSNQDISLNLLSPSSPPTKKQCRSDSETKNVMMQNQEEGSVNSFILQNDMNPIHMEKNIMEPKEEMPEYLSDDDLRDDGTDGSLYAGGDVTEFPGGMDIIPHATGSDMKDPNHDPNYDHCQGADTRKLHSLDPRPCEECGRVYSNLSNLRQHMKLIHYPTYVKCPLCQKPFKTDLYLKRHLISSHEKNYIRTNMAGRFNNVTITNIGNMFQESRDVKYSTMKFHNFCDTELTEGNFT